MNPLRHKIDLAARLLESKNEIHTATFIRHQLAVMDDVWSGKPYLGASYYIPGELLSLFDLPVLYMERITGLGAAQQLFKNLGYLKARYQLPSIGCNYQLFYHSMIEEGIIPAPAGFIASSYACDDAFMYCKAASVKYGIPFYYIDVMKNCRHKAAGQIAVQLKQAYDDLRKTFDQVYSFKEVADKSNRAMGIKQEIDNIRFRFPGIRESMNAFKLFTVYNDLGRDTAVEVLSGYLEHVKRKIQCYKEEPVPKLLWLGIIPLYRNRIIEEIETKYRCEIVYEELFDFGNQTLTEEGFFTGLAERIAASVFYSLENRMEAIKRYADRFNIDGIIHFSQDHCRFLPPMFPALSRKLEEMKIPVVEICGDAVDPAGFNPEQYMNRLDAFFEMLQARRLHHERRGDEYAEYT